MAEASTDSPLDWCRGRFLVPGHPLTLTLPYAAEADRDRLLALRAVISEIAAVPGQVSDAGVARRKLGWWRDAIENALPHPALEALRVSGAAQRVAPSLLLDLVTAVEATVDAPRFETVAELDTHARGLSAPWVRAEARLVEPEAADATIGSLTGLAAAAYRVRLARDLVLDARQHRWSVPLELQAEFQLTRAQVAGLEMPHRIRALLAHLAGQAVRAMENDRAVLEPSAAWMHRHAVLGFELDRMLARRIVRAPGRALERRLPASGPLAAFGLWRQARKLRRAHRRAG